MGYFSNGTEGEMYFEDYCSKCVHDRNEDCPIWAIHLQFNYDQFGEDEKAKSVKSILDQLIPRDKADHGNKQCSMFMREEASGDLLEEQNP